MPPSSVTNGSADSYAFIIASQLECFVVGGQGGVVVSASGNECRYWMRSFRCGLNVTYGVSCAMFFG